MARPEMPKPDVSEKGRGPDGQIISLDRRLFMQLLVYDECPDPQPLMTALTGQDFDAVLYCDLHNPLGVGLLTCHEDPGFFTDKLGQLLTAEPFASLVLNHDLTMFGRTYASGYETDLQDSLLQRPRRTVMNADWPWSIWYPLRRNGAFAQLDEGEQRKVLMEHGVIGRAYGEADLAHDVRLACYGLDRHDNDFLIGLIGKALHPLSAVVAAMRKTQQTSLYIDQLGPFFVGKAVWRSA